MISYYLSEKEYNEVRNRLSETEGAAIAYHGLIIQLIDNEIICTYQKDVLSGNYEWYFIPNPEIYSHS